MERCRCDAPWPRIWPVEQYSRRDMERASENDCLAGVEDGHLIQKASGLHRNDAAEMIDVVGILKSVADEVGALADDRLTDFAWPLARDDEG